MADEYISNLKIGDADAYEDLVRQFETPLYRYFLSSHGDPQLVSEQSADCFSDLVEAIPKMTGGSAQLRPFVFSVARNVLRRQWRNQKRDKSYLSADEEVIDSSPSPDQQLVATEEKSELTEAIRSLDQATRDVFLLRYVEQFSIAEVSEAVGVPEGTVKSRLHRGRRQLQIILQARSELQ